jgi:hypothetical protein
MRGIDPQDLKQFAHFGLAENSERPEVQNPGERYLEAFPALGGRWIQKPGDFERYLSRFPLESLERVFTLEENYRLWMQSAWQCPFGERVRKSLGPERALYKIQNSMWRSHFKRDWNQVVRVLEGIPKFRLGDLELRLDITTGSNDKGYCVFHRSEKDGLPKDKYLYLDGTMGFVIYHKGKPVGVIGFSPIIGGVLLNQVQMIKPKGNRWLYKLEKPLFEMVAEAMCEAFSDCGGVFLVQGASAVQQIRQAYGTADSVKPEVASRIQAFYDQPLSNLNRGETLSVRGNLFYRLEAAWPQ